MCGPGITKGTALSFNFPYDTGTAWTASEMTQLQSNAASVGIKLNLEPKPFAQVTALAAGNCVVVKAPCDWDMANWGGGWSFAPDYLPTGEELFISGAVANSGGYSSSTNDSLIEKTLTSNNVQDMYSWQDYLAPQLPHGCGSRRRTTSSTRSPNNLKGVTPLSPDAQHHPGGLVLREVGTPAGGRTRLTCPTLRGVAGVRPGTPAGTARKGERWSFS